MIIVRERKPLEIKNKLKSGMRGRKWKVYALFTEKEKDIRKN